MLFELNFNRQQQAESTGPVTSSLSKNHGHSWSADGAVDKRVPSR